MYLLLALLSGAPALVYQVVWTREVALLVGSQIEATSIVLAAFERALARDPNFREPLVNAGLLAVAAGDRPTALRLLARLEELDPRVTSAEERALAEALAAI